MTSSSTKDIHHLTHKQRIQAQYLALYTGVKDIDPRTVPKELINLYTALGIFAERSIPGFRVIVKDPSYKNQEYGSRSHRVTFALGRLMFFIFRVLSFGLFKKQFSDFGNAMGSTIYMPAHRIHPGMPNYYAMLRHELQHLLDMKRHGIFFHIGYALSGKRRATFEMRAYAQSILGYWMTEGVIGNERIEFYASQFWSPSYLWMYPFPKKVRESLANIEALVRSNKISSYDVADLDVWNIKSN